MRILIMAGGTGGHIFPALAVARKLIQHGHDVQWLGTYSGMEYGIATNNNIQIHCITIGGLRGKNLQTKLLAPWRLLRSLLQSIFVMLKFKPDLVLGMGGYVTGPAGLAAWLLRRKLVIHEQNAVAGFTNKILARLSYKVLAGFPKSFPCKTETKLTGNPVREEFHNLLPPEQRSNKDKDIDLKILVIGGSSGARTLNNIIPQIINSWVGEHKLMIWHQTGTKNITNAQQSYADCNIDIHNDNIKLVAFIEDMPSAYSWADIIICRAGALTIAEIAASGIASILIPYPYAVDDHQTKNAEYLSNAGAAIIIQERDLKLEKLRDLLIDFASKPHKLQAMAQAAYSLAKPDALRLVVEHCVS